MNKTPTLLFTLIGLTLSLSAITTIPIPAVYAGGGDNDDGNDNKQKVEDDSAAAIADCDWNDVEEADFDCIASAASDESVIRDKEPTPTEPRPETATLNVCKEVVNVDNADAVPSDFILRFDRGNNPIPDEFPGNADCTEVTIGPGEYVIAEEEFNRDLAVIDRSASGDCVSTVGIDSPTATGTITAGETQTCTITNTVSIGE
jgi:hypothetical protein